MKNLIVNTYKPYKLSIGFLLILTVLASLPLPLSNEQAKQLLVARLEPHLNQIITVQEATLQLLPTPQMRINKLQLTTQDQELASAEQILLPIDPLQWLLRGETSIPEIHIEQLKIQPELLPITINELNQMQPFNWPPINVAHTTFGTLTNSNLTLTIITDQEGTTQITFQQQKDVLIIQPKRAGRSVLLDIATSKWQLDTDHVLTQFTGMGRITDTKLEFNQLQANLDTGQIHGELRFTREQTWNVAGSLTLEQIPIEVLLNWINIPVLYGATTGTLYLDSTGHDIAELIHNAAMSGQLDINSGKLVGIDLITPIHSQMQGNIKDNATGGITPFTNLQLELEHQSNGEWLATINNLQTDNLNGSGLIRINEGMLLDGIIEMRLKAHEATPKTIPLLITGSITEALVQAHQTVPK